MKSFRCRGLLFDMDGVLVDSTAVVERTWRRWARRYDLDPGPLLAAAHGRRTRDTLRSVLPGLGLAVDIDEAVAWLDGTEFDDLEGVTAIPGAPALLGAVPRARWAIVTSSGRELAHRRLGRAGLPVPDTLVTSESITRGKPAPDGYLQGAAALGLAPADCLVFEDTGFGIDAGRAAGATVVGLATTFGPEQLARADAFVADLRAVSVAADGDGLVVRLDPA
jgi:sugar-phosphatase